MDRPVRVAGRGHGFLFGAAIDVVIGELPKLTGTEASGSNSLRELGSWLRTLVDIQLATLVVGAAARAVVFGLREEGSYLSVAQAIEAHISSSDKGDHRPASPDVDHR